MLETGATPGHDRERGTEIKPDAQIRWQRIAPPDFVKSHKHNRGHFTIVVGDITMRTPHGWHRIVNDWFYVPADLEHELHPNAPSTYFCVGREDF